MEGLLSGYVPYIIGVIVVAASIVYFMIKKIYPTVRRDFPANTVVLRQVGRGPYAPSLSPFPIKLETYLKMAKISFVSDHKSGMSPKGKTPWISYNNEDISDSQFCIEFLNKKFEVDLNKHLSQEEKAIAKAFQIMVEDNIYWVLVMGRWFIPEYKDVLSMVAKFMKIPTLLFPLVRRWIRSYVHGQGIGRHSKTEVEHIGEASYAALSHFIAQKPFLMGAEPCEADCAVFGMLAQAKWQMPGCPHETLVNETYPNLSAYCDRMKERFWPDWDDCVTHGGTTTPSK